MSDAALKRHEQHISDLVAEFNAKNGDIELACRDGVVVQCHACVLTFQSNVIRTSLKHTGKRLDCKKYLSSTIIKMVELMYSVKVVFTSRNEMFQVLFAATYYNVKWLSTAIQSAIELHCTRDKNEKINATNCRDTLLVLQENITYSVENPNPRYAPFDLSVDPLTGKLQNYLLDCAIKGVSPVDIDTVAIANSVYDYLDQDIKDRRLSDEGPIANLLALCYDEGNMNRNDIFHAIIRRDATLTKLLLKFDRATVHSFIRCYKTLRADHIKTTQQLRAERQKKRRNSYDFL